jgi:hypothetical protein
MDANMNFKNWTPQMIFDHLVKTSKEGGFPSILHQEESYPYCQYRGENNKKCAFGLFISDDIYDPLMERNAARVLLNPDSFLSGNVVVLKEKGVIDKLKESLPEWSLVEGFWNSIQQKHDTLSYRWNHEEFVSGIKEVFYKFKLEVK